MSSKHHGVVYTRKWVVDLILDIAGYTVDKPLHEYTICEPSCGCGAFVAEIASRLAEAAVRCGHADYDDLKGCLRAYDTDVEAASAAKDAIAEALIRGGIDRSTSIRLSQDWVRIEDFILAPPGAYDFVVGNPPYLRATEIDPHARDLYCEAVSSMTRGCDLFVAFIQRGMEQLAPGGSLTYICADRWLQNQYGKTLRGYLVREGYTLDCLVRMHGVDAFEEEVDAYPAITRISRDGGELQYVNCSSDFNEHDAGDLRLWLERPDADLEAKTFSAAVMGRMADDAVMPLSTPSRVRMVRSLVSAFPALEESGISLGIGLATGNDDVFIVDDPDLIEPDRLLPAFSMRDYRRHTRKQRWLANPWTRENELVDLDEYPKLKAHYMANREALSKRHVARKGAWYRTIDKPKWSLMGRPMLLFPDMATKSDPVYSPGDKYPCHNCYWMVSDTWDLNVLGGLLMSDIAEAFVEAMCVKMRGGTLRFQAQYLRLIHVPPYERIDARTRGMLADAFASCNREAASRAARLAYGLET